MAFARRSGPFSAPEKTPAPQITLDEPAPARQRSVGTSRHATSAASLDRAGKSDQMLLAAVRAVLAVAGLLIIWISPDEPERFVGLTYSSLIGYLGYSAWAVWAVSRSRARLPSRTLAWVDVLFAGYLVALTQGTNSIFFFFFFFAILSAAFTRGYREGMRITVASAVLFVVAGLVMTPFPQGQVLDRTFIRPVYLLALGFLVSYWGGKEIELRRRLAFLREIGLALDSRAGTATTVNAALGRLCMFFDATGAVLALRRPGPSSAGTIFSVSRRGEVVHAPMPASEATMRQFMGVPERAVTWPRPTIAERYVALDSPSFMRDFEQSVDGVAGLAHLLEAKCIAIAGYRQRDGADGRLVITRARRRFRDGDAVFLAQCARALATVVENVQLTEELIARTAEYERLSISRDLHDTTIQPYVGLRMAIEGMAREFRGEDRVAARLRELAEMTDVGIQELRDYARRLKSGVASKTGSLQAAIERQAARFARFYDLDVDVQVEPGLQLETRLADPVFQMVTEGLSNVVRHTAARHARVSIWTDEVDCNVEIANPVADGTPGPPSFVPRSIAGRAGDLGGRFAVKPLRNGFTVVSVSLPLRRAVAQ